MCILVSEFVFGMVSFYYIVMCETFIHRGREAWDQAEEAGVQVCSPADCSQHRKARHS